MVLPVKKAKEIKEAKEAKEMYATFNATFSFASFASFDSFMKAFILAGGFATRLWPLTEKRAKPLLPLAGVPLVEHLVRDIPEDIPVTISTNAVFKEDFENWAMQYDRSNITILI